MVNPTRTLYDTADRPTRITLPDGSITSYAYAIRSITYDPLGRITGIGYPDMRDVTYTYAVHCRAGA